MIKSLAAWGLSVRVRALGLHQRNQNINQYCLFLNATKYPIPVELFQLNTTYLYHHGMVNAGVQVTFDKQKLCREC